MAIKGEVHIRKALHLPIASFNQGRYVIRPFECEATGKAEGRAQVKASIHTLLTTFDDEEWKIITLMVEHLDSQLKYTDLFAPSCGSIGDFTDIKKYEEGYVLPAQMQTLTSRCANSMAPFMSKFIRLTRSSFAQKCIQRVHCCSPRITPNLLCCNICASNSNMPKSPSCFFLTFRNTGLMMMEQ